jgi:hypothetical protein
MQSRGPRVNDILSEGQVNEIADAPRGITSSAPQKSIKQTPSEAEISCSVENLNQELRGIRQSVAEIRKDGSVEIKEVGRTNPKDA